MEKHVLRDFEEKFVPKKELIAHEDIRIDNYYWLNDKNDKNVINYLNDENNFTQKTLKNTEDLQQILFDEMKSRIKEDDSSVPYFYNGFWYITRYEKNKQYVLCGGRNRFLYNLTRVMSRKRVLSMTGNLFKKIAG